jgi:hypothetical protein
MIYCVVPKELESELYDKLSDHYAGEDNVTVILERRVADRRARTAHAHVDTAVRQRRKLRDRRRARAMGDTLPLARP